MDFDILEETLGKDIIINLKSLIKIYNDNEDYNYATRKMYNFINIVKDSIVIEFDYKGTSKKFGDVFNINNYKSPKNIQQFIFFRKGAHGAPYNLFWFEKSNNINLDWNYHLMSKDFINIAYNNAKTSNPKSLFVSQIALISQLVTALYNKMNYKYKGRKQYSKKLYFEDMCYLIYSNIPNSNNWILNTGRESMALSSHMKRYERLFEGVNVPERAKLRIISF